MGSIPATLLTKLFDTIFLGTPTAQEKPLFMETTISVETFYDNAPLRSTFLISTCVEHPMIELDFTTNTSFVPKEGPPQKEYKVTISTEDSKPTIFEFGDADLRGIEFGYNEDTNQIMLTLKLDLERNNTKKEYTIHKVSFIIMYLEEAVYQEIYTLLKKLVSTHKYEMAIGPFYPLAETN